MTAARYAVYFAPAHDSPLDRLASRWLGRCAHTGTSHPPTGLGSIGPGEQETMTAEPRRYGFHATLKPPFALDAGRARDELLSEVETLAAARPPVALDGLRTARLGRFAALVPVRASAEPGSLAADCVSALDRFRAPAGEAELARRRARGLTRRQEELLLAWGYPYVMEEFRFHLSLTGPLPPETSGRAVDTLAQAFDPLCGSSFVIDSLSVFEQPDRHSDFRALERFPLGARSSR